MIVVVNSVTLSIGDTVVLVNITHCSCYYTYPHHILLMIATVATIISIDLFVVAVVALRS